MRCFINIDNLPSPTTSHLCSANTTSALAFCDALLYRCWSTYDRALPRRGRPWRHTWPRLLSWWRILRLQENLQRMQQKTDANTASFSNHGKPFLSILQRKVQDPVTCSRCLLQKRAAGRSSLMRPSFDPALLPYFIMTSTWFVYVGVRIAKFNRKFGKIYS